MTSAVIDVTIVGREAAVARFRDRRARVVGAVYTEMGSQMARLAEYVRASKLSGQVLKNRTGTLRRSIHGEAAVDGNTVTGKTGTNVEYAHVHEDGGLFHIPEHQRQLTMVFGRPIEPRFISVRAHTANFPQRAFLRPSMAERKAGITAALNRTVKQVMTEP